MQSFEVRLEHISNSIAKEMNVYNAWLNDFSFHNGARKKIIIKYMTDSYDDWGWLDYNILEL